jgi:hypothetical protein
MSNEILESYLAAADNFVSVAKSASPEKLATPPSTGEWSGAYVIHHMADFEVHFSHRFLRILTEDNPDIESYDESNYPSVLKYDSRNIGESLNIIVGLRNFIYQTLNNLDDSVLDRPATHSVKGNITLKNILQSSTGHLADHAAQLKTAIA